MTSTLKVEERGKSSTKGWLQCYKIWGKCGHDGEEGSNIKKDVVYGRPHYTKFWLQTKVCVLFLIFLIFCAASIEVIDCES